MGGLNTYVYANDNPISFVDLTGLNGVTAFGGLLTESYNFASGNPYDFGSVFGALKDGYNGEGSGALRSFGEDALSFGAGALGAAAKVCKLGAAAANELNFTNTTLKHMNNPNRFVPAQILREAINSSRGLPDPQGTSALMHTVEMMKNGKMYNLEVLYDSASNTVLHFKYFN